MRERCRHCRARKNFAVVCVLGVRPSYYNDNKTANCEGRSLHETARRKPQNLQKDEVVFQDIVLIPI